MGKHLKEIKERSESDDGDLSIRQKSIGSAKPGREAPHDKIIRALSKEFLHHPTSPSKNSWHRSESLVEVLEGKEGRHLKRKPTRRERLDRCAHDLSGHD